MPSTLAGPSFLAAASAFLRSLASASRCLRCRVSCRYVTQFQSAHQGFAFPHMASGLASTLCQRISHSPLHEKQAFCHVLNDFCCLASALCFLHCHVSCRQAIACVHVGLMTASRFSPFCRQRGDVKLEDQHRAS